MLDMLANYDLFQLENNIKPDYSNMGGLSVFEDGEWCEWESEDGDDIHQYITDMEEADKDADQAIAEGTDMDHWNYIHQP